MPSPEGKSKPSYFSRNSGRLSSYQSNKDEDLVAGANDEPTLALPTLSNSHSQTPTHVDDGFVVVDSPNSKAKSKGAPTQLPPPIDFSSQPSENLLDEGDFISPSQTQSYSQSHSYSQSLGQGQTHLHPRSGERGERGERGYQPKNRVKNLPTPPVGPVLPDFDDLMVSRKASRSPSGYSSQQPQGGGVAAGEAGAVKRKPSVVKRMRDKMVK